MHELAVTRSLLNQVLEEAGRHVGARVNRVRVLVGESSSIVPDCVRFYFDDMKRGTVAEHAVLEFATVPLRIRCPKCGQEFGRIEEMCGCNAGGELLSGQELTVESIDID